MVDIDRAAGDIEPVIDDIDRDAEDIELNIGDIDLFVFHQASALTLDSLERILKIPSGKSFRCLETIGNTVSASIPIALAMAEQAGRIVPGMRLLVAGFGVGLSAGTALIEV